MRLRTFQASNMTEAMQLVRDALGPNAIIVSTHQSERGRGVTVSAAIEEDDELDPAPAENNESDNDEISEQEGALREILSFHGVPDRIAQRLLRVAADIPSDDNIEALGGAIDSSFTFDSVFEQPSPWVLIGPTGSGKTITAAKLAAQLAFQKKPATIITTDTVRAGAVAQLQGYTDVLGFQLLTADRPEKLGLLVNSCPADHTVIIDTPGSNPFNEAEMADLAGFVKPLQVNPILVLSAGGDAEEAVDVTRAFARFHCRTMIATRIDCCRRLGSLLAASEAGHLALAEIGFTSSIAQGLKLFTPLKLARVLVREPLEKMEYPLAGAVRV